MSTAVVQRDLDTDHMAAQEGEWGGGLIFMVLFTPGRTAGTKARDDDAVLFLCYLLFPMCHLLLFLLFLPCLCSSTPYPSPVNSASAIIRIQSSPSFS